MRPVYRIRAWNLYDTNHGLTFKHQLRYSAVNVVITASYIFQQWTCNVVALCNAIIMYLHNGNLQINDQP